MKVERFSGVVVEGQKELAVEVPFDPTIRWGRPATRLEPGRHGHGVRGQLNGITFESVVLSRARGFFLVVTAELLKAASLTAGDAVQVAIHLAESPSTVPAPPSLRARRPDRNHPPATP